MKGEKKKPTSDCRTERHSCFLWIKTTHLYNLVKAGANTAKPDYINEAVSKLKRPMTKLCLVILSFAKNLNTSTLCFQILHFIQNDNNTRLLKSFPVIIDSVHWCKWCALRMTELNDSISNRLNMPPDTPGANYFFNHLSSQLKNVRCHNTPFWGFNTQWFSSG